MSDTGRYWYKNGYNPDAVAATAIAGSISIASVVLPKLLEKGLWISDYSWFIGCGIGFVAYYLLASRVGSPTQAALDGHSRAS
jgi:nucleobase:cation symporter-1, NCS1 family